MKNDAGREVLEPQRNEEFVWYLYAGKSARPIRLRPSYLRVRRPATHRFSASPASPSSRARTGDRDV